MYIFVSVTYSMPYRHQSLLSMRRMIFVHRTHMCYIKIQHFHYFNYMYESKTILTLKKFYDYNPRSLKKVSYFTQIKMIQKAISRKKKFTIKISINWIEKINNRITIDIHFLYWRKHSECFLNQTSLEPV